MSEPVWISTELTLAIHKRQLAEHGGIEGVRDEGLLSSALARPRNLLAYSKDAPDLASFAAAYGFGIARNHPFLDGNKRTAYVVCRTFLKLNNTDIDATQEEKYLAFLQLAEGLLGEEELVEWIRSHLQPS
ncbi:MAG: type II toxin-antitoxin system death-on-curing family toxin [Planctomycetes bacterium]|nr:type II toxin-antitoxin system death-on-curing family toxin [Planctomycetota bacterium]